MPSIIRTRIFARNFKYMLKRVTKEELNTSRVKKICPLPMLHPTNDKNNDIFLEKFDVSEVKKHPNGNGNNDSQENNFDDTRRQREEEIRRLQDLRQREIDHQFESESVWKGIRDRDRIFGRKQKDKENEKSDNDDEK